MISLHLSSSLFSDVTDWVAEEEGWPSTYVVHSSLNAFASICTTSEYNHSFELLWVLVGSIFIGALYHPPRALYTTDTLLSYTESCIIEIATLLLSATIILAGDFNQLSDDDVVQCTGLISIVTQPTRAASHLSYRPICIVSGVSNCASC